MDDVTSTAISIGEFSRLSGLTTHTLRFYEAQGILRPAARAANGHRRYRRDDLLWVEFVLRLKRTGMPLAEIRRYAELRAAGDDTVPPRLAMLELHRQRLATAIEELSTCAAALDAKIGIYRDLLAKPAAAKRKKRP